MLQSLKLLTGLITVTPYLSYPGMSNQTSMYLEHNKARSSGWSEFAKNK